MKRIVAVSVGQGPNGTEPTTTATTNLRQFSPPNGVGETSHLLLHTTQNLNSNSNSNSSTSSNSHSHSQSSSSNSSNSNSSSDSAVPSLLSISTNSNASSLFSSSSLNINLNNSITTAVSGVTDVTATSTSTFVPTSSIPISTSNRSHTNIIAQNISPRRDTSTNLHLNSLSTPSIQFSHAHYRISSPSVVMSAENSNHLNNTSTSTNNTSSSTTRTTTTNDNNPIISRTHSVTNNNNQDVSILRRHPNMSSLLSSSSSSPPGNINYLTSRSRSRDEVNFASPPVSPVMKRGRGGHHQHHHHLLNPHQNSCSNSKSNSKSNSISDKKNYKLEREKEKILQREIIKKKNTRRAICNELGKNARKENDAMVYLDGPRIYTCGECRTHLTSHDEIISKSFHGRHGRAYLFDNCVNVTTGPAEDRRLITGLHSVCDIFCKRCNTLIGWTYSKAYEQSQKYKEGKFIIEKIHLHMEESDCYQVNLPAGEKRDRWRIRSMSWGSESCSSSTASPRYCGTPHGRGRSCSGSSSIVYEYGRFSSSSMGGSSPKPRSRTISSEAVSSLGSPLLLPSSPAFARPPSPPNL